MLLIVAIIFSFAIDAHDPGDNFHPETKLFPPHNIIGTSGRDLFGPLNDFYQQHKDDTPCVLDGQTPLLVLLGN